MNEKELQRARERLEGKVKLSELDRKLDEIELVGDNEVKQVQQKRQLNVIKTIAWLVLLGAVVITVLPAIGRGWMLFQFQLSYFIAQGFFGFGVVLGVLAVLWALYVIIFK